MKLRNQNLLTRSTVRILALIWATLFFCQPVLINAQHIRASLLARTIVAGRAGRCLRRSRNQSVNGPLLSCSYRKWDNAANTGNFRR